MQDQPNKKLQNKLMEAAGGGWGRGGRGRSREWVGREIQHFCRKKVEQKLTKNSLRGPTYSSIGFVSTMPATLFQPLRHLSPQLFRNPHTNYSAGFETNSQPALWQTSDHSTVEGSRLYTDVALIIGA